MCLVTAFAKSRAQLRATFRQDNPLVENDCITSKMRRFFRNNLNPIPNMTPNGPLTVVIECLRIPNCAPIWQRTKACVQVIKPVLYQFYGYDEFFQLLANNLVRSNI